MTGAKLLQSSILHNAHVGIFKSFNCTFFVRVFDITNPDVLEAPTTTTDMRLLGLVRIFHGSPAAITDMAVLLGVLGCRPLRRTVQVRKPTPCGCQVARPSSRSRDSDS
jgi:hypothetical protein